MRYIANIHCFDVMDIVHISTRVTSYDLAREPGKELVWRSELLLSPEEGLEPSEWLSDVLTYLLESL